MAQTQIKQTEAGEVIETTNGITTVTAAMMKVARREYPNFDPRSGVNVELLRAVVENLTAHKEWWDQGSWRTVLEPYEQTIGQLDSLPSVVAYVDVEPSCGTALCFAGWATEITPTDFVVDATWALAARTDPDLEYWADKLESYVLVRADQVHDFTEFENWDDVIGGDSKVEEMLRKRGFTSDTHVLVEISEVAQARLGIPGDPFDLFGGSNSFEQVLIKARTYEKCTVPPDEAQYSAEEQKAYRAAILELVAEGAIDADEWIDWSVETDEEED